MKSGLGLYLSSGVKNLGQIIKKPCGDNIVFGSSGVQKLGH